jgi:circadian clock protein KaiB
MYDAATAFGRASTSDERDEPANPLAGNEYAEPIDIDLFFDPIGVDPLLDQPGTIVTHRRNGQDTRRRSRPPSPHRGESHDNARPGKATKIELVLYTSASSEKCLKALRTIREVLDQYEMSQVKFSVCDLSGRPSLGDADSVVFTPTLVKRGPGPRTWIVGNLDQAELLLDLLDVSGVERKRDGRR